MLVWWWAQHPGSKKRVSRNLSERSQRKCQRIMHCILSRKKKSQLLIFQEFHLLSSFFGGQNHEVDRSSKMASKSCSCLGFLAQFPNNIQAADFATYPRILQSFPKKSMMPQLKCPNKKARQKGIIQPLKFLLAFSRPQGDLLFLYVLHITNVVFSWLPGSGLWCLSIDGALYHC